MSSTSKPLLAIFGATGGSTLNAVVQALNAGYEIIALARTPAKLTDALLNKGVPQATLDSLLHISKGDVRDVSNVKTCLTHDGRPAEMIITGVGATSLSELASGALDLCTIAMTNILAALGQLKSESGAGSAWQKPLLVALSTTGIYVNEEPRDLPLLMMPLYKGLLHNPHKDKVRMEEIVVEEWAKDTRERLISGYVLTRAALLTNGPALGGSHIRTGIETNPAVGYTISRDDVGLWIFETLIVGKGRDEFINHKPTLCY